MYTFKTNVADPDPGVLVRFGTDPDFKLHSDTDPALKIWSIPNPFNIELLLFYIFSLKNVEGKKGKVHLYNQKKGKDRFFLRDRIRIQLFFLKIGSGSG